MFYAEDVTFYAITSIHTDPNGLHQVLKKYPHCGNINTLYNSLYGNDIYVAICQGIVLKLHGS